MVNFSKLIGLGGGNKKSSIADPLKTRIPGSAVGFEKKITKQGMRKIIRTTRVNGEIISSDKLRDELVGLVKKAGTKGLSGKQLEKKLREDYKMSIKDRKRVTKGVVKHWAKSEKGLTEKQRLRMKTINITAYEVDRNKEFGISESLKNKRKNKNIISNITRMQKRDKITVKRFGVKATDSESSISASGKMPKSGVANNYNNKSGFAIKNNNASSVAGGFGSKLGGPKLGNLNGKLLKF